MRWRTVVSRVLSEAMAGASTEGACSRLRADPHAVAIAVLIRVPYRGQIAQPPRKACRCCFFERRRIPTMGFFAGWQAPPHRGAFGKLVGRGARSRARGLMGGSFPLGRIQHPLPATRRRQRFRPVVPAPRARPEALGASPALISFTMCSMSSRAHTHRADGDRVDMTERDRKPTHLRHARLGAYLPRHRHSVWLAKRNLSCQLHIGESQDSPGPGPSDRPGITTMC